jgi:hypothetical protein
MTMTRIVLVVLLLLALEVAAFAVYYRDLIFLRTATAGVAASDLNEFRTHATSALTRGKLTRRHLDTIVNNAREHGLLDLELQAAKRTYADFPTDPNAILSLADVLRRSGHLDAADALYQQLAERSRDVEAP